MTLGLASAHVSLMRAHDAWAAAYERERVKIAAALGDQMIRIEHVGSTSIPDVPAKPILDILVGVHDFHDARVCVGPMMAIGYSYRGENGIPERHYFVKGEPRTHHVHMVEAQSENWRITLRFRDLLRIHPDLAGEYSREKERLARMHFDNREAYQREKDRVIESILGRNASG
jgi:GrpB-like predicted nucleotidyltransferase (UPF0157 family)